MEQAVGAGMDKETREAVKHLDERIKLLFGLLLVSNVLTALAIWSVK